MNAFLKLLNRLFARARGIGNKMSPKKQNEIIKALEESIDKVTAVTAKIEPAVKATVGTGQQITYNSPKGLFRMDTDDLGWQTNEVSVYGISFSCTEAL